MKTIEWAAFFVFWLWLGIRFDVTPFTLDYWALLALMIARDWAVRDNAIEYVMGRYRE